MHASCRKWPRSCSSSNDGRAISARQTARSAISGCEAQHDGARLGPERQQVVRLIVCSRQLGVPQAGRTGPRCAGVQAGLGGLGRPCVHRRQLGDIPAVRCASGSPAPARMNSRCADSTASEATRFAPSDGAPTLPYTPGVARPSSRRRGGWAEAATRGLASSACFRAWPPRWCEAHRGADLDELAARLGLRHVAWPDVEGVARLEYFLATLEKRREVVRLADRHEAERVPVELIRAAFRRRSGCSDSHHAGCPRSRVSRWATPRWVGYRDRWCGGLWPVPGGLSRDVGVQPVRNAEWDIRSARGRSSGASYAQILRRASVGARYAALSAGKMGSNPSPRRLVLGGGHGEPLAQLGLPDEVSDDRF